MAVKYQDQKTINILYITGAGRSGSTLLDLLLGSHSRNFSLGEINNLPVMLKKNWACTCGKPLQECDFWKDMLRGLSADSYRQLRKTDFFYPARSTRSLFSDLFSNQYSPLQKKGDNLSLEKEIFGKIVEKTSAAFLVDSSKSISRGRYLSREKNFNVYYIFLVRDGRGYVNSVGRPPRLKAIHNPKGRKKPPFEASLRWMKHNIVTYIGLLKHRRKTLIVSYEDLARYPEGTLKRICGFAGLDYEPAMLNYKNFSHHNIGGNRMRYRKNTAIVLNEKWKTSLSVKDKMIFHLTAGICNIFLRFNVVLHKKLK